MISHILLFLNFDGIIVSPNTGHELLPEAGAQRTLEAVSSMPWFGVTFLETTES
jgi:hypothetical protein